MVDHVATLARANSATPGHVALAWLLARHPRIAPIPGTRRVPMRAGRLRASARMFSAALVEQSLGGLRLDRDPPLLR
ncbi:aldo/keto reductase [Streptomyces sp. NPDC006335]|uniref:aldo/keto reductase n=1 Tax=Streptomyces sp. NPDC006335 TaxID=3156895 RepID=UPI0033BE51C2